MVDELDGDRVGTHDRTNGKTHEQVVDRHVPREHPHRHGIDTFGELIPEIAEMLMTRAKVAFGVAIWSHSRLTAPAILYTHVPATIIRSH